MLDRESIHSNTVESGAYSVEIRVRIRTDAWRRGSGYVVASNRILTALHVVIGDEAVKTGGIVEIPDRIEVRTQGDFAMRFPEAADVSLDRGLAAIREKANGDYLWRRATMLWPVVSASTPTSDLAVLAVDDAEALLHVRQPLPLRCIFPTGNLRCIGTGFPRWTDEQTIEGVSLTNPSTVIAELFESPSRFGGIHSLYVINDTPREREGWAGLSGTAFFSENSRDLVGIATQARSSQSQAGLWLTRLADLVERSEFDTFWDAAQLKKPSKPPIKLEIKIGSKWRTPELQRSRVFIERPIYTKQLEEHIQQIGKTVTAVTGFGGHGKTELVMRWLHSVRHDAALEAFEGVFWYSIEPGGNFAIFVDELQSWLGLTDYANNVVSNGSKLETVISSLRAHKILVIIDNFERLLDIVDDESSLVKDPLAFDLLYQLLSNQTASKVIFLSRSLPTNLPLKDDTEINVEAFSTVEAKKLIEAFGLIEDRPEIQEIINGLNRHPLALSLAARTLSRSYKLSRRRRSDLLNELRYLKSVDDIFKRYDEILPASDLDICILISQIRQPCTLPFIERVLAAAETRDASKIFFSELRERLSASLKRLLRVGLVARENKRIYLHPLIMRYYRARIEKWSKENQIALHRAIAVIFREDAEHFKQASVGNIHRTVGSFRPYIEQVYHLCCAGQQGRRTSLTEALGILRSDIDNWDNYTLTGGLAAWITRTDLLAGFFNGRDFSKNLLAGIGPASRSLILNEAGQCHMHQGWYATAEALLLRKIEADEVSKRHGVAAVGCRNLSDVFLFKGELDNAIHWMRKSLDLSTIDGSLEHLVSAGFGLGVLLSLVGRQEADAQFCAALRAREKLEAKQGTKWVSTRGIREVRYAEHLLKMGAVDRAVRFIGGEVVILSREQLDADLALALRVQGDCLTQHGTTAEWLFEEALSLARRCEEPFILVDCELAWCRSQIRQGNIDKAEEVLKLALARSNRLELKVHIISCGLVGALIANVRGDQRGCSELLAEAKLEAEEIGYVWIDFCISSWGIRS